MLEKLKKNWNLIICLIIMCVLTGVMFFYIDKKEGFHEDEIFSYTASNGKYSNILLTYAKTDDVDTIIKTENPFETIKNLIYYKIINTDAYDAENAELQEKKTGSIWRTREEAIETMQIDSVSEALDFFTVYWNTARDVHPPAFYFLVHLVSILFYAHFSKYIIFIINLAFFLATCVFLRKIMKKIDKENLSIPLLILYGLSIGAISTVMFQRMYMMLTFFTVYFLYINLKIYYNNFELSKNQKIELCIVTILGFLTQYYFCIYALAIVIVMITLMIIQNSKENIKVYVLQFVKSAVMGVLLFLPSIYHIFFSYRGASGGGSEYTFLEMMKSFIENIFDAFSLSNLAGLVISIIFLIILVIQCRKKEKRQIYGLLIIPVILNFIIVCKLSPYRSLRYVMNILPIIAIVVVCLADDIFKNKKVSFIFITVFSIGLSIWGLLTNGVKYLYIGYNDYLDIAEEYSEDRFVLVCTTTFNHIYDIPEMKIYKESIVIDPKNLNELTENEELQNEEEFILSIKNWVGDVDEILSEVLKNTGFSNYELLLNTGNSANCSVYRVY